MTGLLFAFSVISIEEFLRRRARHRMLPACLSFYNSPSVAKDLGVLPGTSDKAAEPETSAEHLLHLGVDLS